MNAIWFSLLLLCSTATVKSGQESVQFLTFEASSESGTLPLAIQVENEHLKNISLSLLMAETWVRTHVLSNYPAKNVSIIIIGHNILCRKIEEKKLGLVLPAVKNIYYSLTRWGLQNDIKVSTTFTSECFDSQSEGYRVDLAESHIKPLVNTLDEIGSPYVVNPPRNLNVLSDETLILLKSHIESMKELGFVHMNNRINMIVSSPRMQKTVGRKLSFIDFNSIIDPFPQRPTTLIAPTHAPLPPLIGIVSPPPNPLPFAPSLSPVANPTIPPFLPHLAPMVNPATPPFGPHLPPCSPPEGGGPVGAPEAGMHNGVWCVAKPSVPSETLQEALDFACGEGGADCEAITPRGSCYFPDSLVAHASYAFNSYWQKTKKNGGTCGFGGTAMLINSDPSYSHCRFILT